MKFLAKFKSRKFAAAAVGIAVGIAMIFGVDANTITTVAGAVMSLASLVTYIAVEGKIDAAAVAETASRAEAALEEVKKTVG